MHILELSNITIALATWVIKYNKRPILKQPATEEAIKCSSAQRLGLYSLVVDWQHVSCSWLGQEGGKDQLWSYYWHSVLPYFCTEKRERNQEWFCGNDLKRKEIPTRLHYSRMTSFLINTCQWCKSDFKRCTACVYIALGGEEVFHILFILQQHILITL